MRWRAWAALAAFFIFGATADAQVMVYENTVFSASGRPIGNATIRVCTSAWAGTAASDCSPLDTLYTDSTAGTVKSNPFNADAFGNYRFGIGAGRHFVQITGPGVTRTQFEITVACNPSGVCAITGGFTGVTRINDTFYPGTATGTVTPPDTAPTIAQEATTGGSIADGTYYCVTTYGNRNGETTQSPQTSVTISAGTGTARIRIRPADFQWLTGAFKFRAYCGTVNGGPYWLQTPSAFAIDTNWHYPNVNNSGDIIITSVAGSGSNPPASNTATIDAVQVAVNSARTISALNVTAPKTVQLLSSTYTLTTPLILGRVTLLGHFPSVNGVATDFATTIKCTWSDADEACVMALGREVILDRVNVRATGTTNAVMILSGDHSLNGIRFSNAEFSIPSASGSTVAALNVYHVKEAHDWIFWNLTLGGGRRGIWFRNANLGNGHWYFGRINCGTDTAAAAIEQDAGFTDIDRSANFNPAAIAMTFHGVAVESAKGIVVNWNGGFFGWVDGSQSADQVITAGTEAIFKFGSDATSNGSSHAGILIRDSLVTGHANASATIKMASGASDYGAAGTVNKFENGEITGSGGSSVAIDLNTQAISIYIDNVRQLNPDPAATSHTIINPAGANRRNIISSGLLFNQPRLPMRFVNSSGTVGNSLWRYDTGGGIEASDLQLLDSAGTNIIAEWEDVTQGGGGHNGYKVNFVKSFTANPATAGFLRLSEAEQLCFRNEANSANVCITKNNDDSFALPALFLAAPPAIGGTTPAAGTFTTVATTGSTPSIAFPNYTTPAVSGANQALIAYQSATQRLTASFNGDAHSNILRAADWAAPGTIGSTTPSTGKFTTLSTATNCADTGLPANCGSAAAGSVIIAVAATTVTVNTTAVTANSQIFVFEDSSLGTRLSTTCDTTIGRNYTITARTAGTSFTITTDAAPANSACLNYLIVN